MWPPLMLLCSLHLSMPALPLPTEPPIIPGAQALEEPGRYQSPRGYLETLDYYRRLFGRTGGVRWRNIVNQPDIRAKHVASLRAKTAWEGLNIYEHQGHVRIYVLRRPTGPPANKGRGAAPLAY